MKALDDIEALARAIDNFDPEETSAACKQNDERPACLSCGGEYYVEIGNEPTALCDGCAHDTLTDLARALLAVLPTIRAAEAWHRVNTGMHTNGPQHTLAMRDTRNALVDAINELRQQLGGE